MIPLSAAELLAAQRKHADRINALRQRGWGRTRPITRSDIYDMRLDQWEMRQGINPSPEGT